jgi:hypothetical protein
LGNGRDQGSPGAFQARDRVCPRLAALAGDGEEAVQPHHRYFPNSLWVDFLDHLLTRVAGETFQANLDDGTEIFLEQTSHHPPASNWEVFGPNHAYHFWGYGEWAASCTGNTIKGFVFPRSSLV